MSIKILQGKAFAELRRLIGQVEKIDHQLAINLGVELMSLEADVAFRLEEIKRLDADARLELEKDLQSAYTLTRSFSDEAMKSVAVMEGLAESKEKPQDMEELLQFVFGHVPMSGRVREVLRQVFQEVQEIVDQRHLRDLKDINDSKNEVLLVLARSSGARRTAAEERVAILADYMEKLAGQVILADKAKKRARQIAKAAKFISRIDPRTGLLNTDIFDRSIIGKIRLERRGRWLALGFIDFTEFADLNKTFGHVVGDQVLRIGGEKLRAIIRPGSDIAGRHGGDEFKFLLTDVRKADDAFRIGDRFKHELESYPWHLIHNNLRVKVDIGVVCIRVPHGEWRRRSLIKSIYDSLISKADAEMYKSKSDHALHAGRMRVKFEGGELQEIDEEIAI